MEFQWSVLRSTTAFRSAPPLPLPSFAAVVLPDIVNAGPLLGFRDGLDLCFLHGHVVGHRSLKESKLQKKPEQVPFAGGFKGEILPHVTVCFTHLVQDVDEQSQEQQTSQDGQDDDPQRDGGFSVRLPHQRCHHLRTQAAGTECEGHNTNNERNEGKLEPIHTFSRPLG